MRSGFGEVGGGMLGGSTLMAAEGGRKKSSMGRCTLWLNQGDRWGGAKFSPRRNHLTVGNIRNDQLYGRVSGAQISELLDPRYCTPPIRSLDMIEVINPFP